MIELKMIATRDDLKKETGLTSDQLWDADFDLDDWDVCFVSDTPLTKEYEEDGFKWDEPIDDAYWLVNRMDQYCCGFRITEHNGKWYYMVYHS